MGEPDQHFIADTHCDAELPLAFETHRHPWKEVGGNRQGILLHARTIGVSVPGAESVVLLRHEERRGRCPTDWQREVEEFGTWRL